MLCLLAKKEGTELEIHINNITIGVIGKPVNKISDYVWIFIYIKESHVGYFMLLIFIVSYSVNIV